MLQENGWDQEAATTPERHPEEAGPGMKGTSRTAGESKGEGALRSVGKGQRGGELSSPVLSAWTHSSHEPSSQQGPELFQEADT